MTSQSPTYTLTKDGLGCCSYRLETDLTAEQIAAAFANEPSSTRPRTALYSDGVRAWGVRANSREIDRVREVLTKACRAARHSEPESEGTWSRGQRRILVEVGKARIGDRIDGRTVHGLGKAFSPNADIACIHAGRISPSADLVQYAYFD